MGGFQSQTSAIWELQEMGLGCGNFLGLVFLFLFWRDFFGGFFFPSCFLLNWKDL